MKKKIMTIAFAAVLAASLTACGSGTSSSDSTSEPEEGVEEVGEEETGEEETEEKEDTKNAKISFEETSVIDNDNCSITITDISTNSSGQYTVDVTFENKTSDLTYMFAVDDAYVNGVYNDPFFATEVAPEKQSKSSLSFSSMEDYGISEFTDIEIQFRVYDSDDWLADNVVNEVIHLYPYGEDAAEVYTRESQDEDIVLVDNEYVTATVVGFEEDPVWGYTMNLYLVNKTDTTVVFSVDDCSVNGYMADPFFATTIAADKCKYSSVSWSEDTLESNGIEDVTEIEFSFRAYDEENYEADDFVNETITVNP